MIVFGLNGVTAKKVSPSPNMNLPSTVKLDDSQRAEQQPSSNSINAAYNVGGKTLALSGVGKSFGEDGYQPQMLWSDQDVFASQYSTPVLHKGMLYGTSGREDFRNGSFRCFDPLTGELKWQQPNIAVGHTLLLGGRLLLVDYKSNLRLIKSSVDGYNQLAEFKLYRSPSKTIPAIANRRLYTRSDGTSATLDCWKLN